MSKMSTLNLELQEQANELGFSTVQEALDNGYEIDYENETLKDSQTAAHEAWLKEKVLKELHSLLQFNKDGANTNYELAYMLEKSLDKIKHAIEFIEKGEA